MKDGTFGELSGDDTREHCVFGIMHPLKLGIL
jgi:hypothetical protein